MEETIGARIRRLREARRWTQEQLADLLEVSTKTVSNWETGRNDPRSSLGALREVFGRQFDAGDEVPVGNGDAVEQAIRASGLREWRQDAVLSTYKRHLYEQQQESATG